MKKITVSLSDDMHYKFVLSSQMQRRNMADVMREAAINFVYQTEKKIGPIVRHASLTITD